MSWTPEDYSGWDWKAVQSAILGSVDTDANTLLAAQQQTSVPQTFYDTGQRWTGLSTDLQTSRTNLAAGSNDLLGGVQPWTGKAADGLRKLVGQFDTAINDHISHLNGPPSAAVTMDNAGDALQSAINDITAANQDAAAQTMTEYQTKLTAFQSGQAGATDPGPSPAGGINGTTLVDVSRYPDVEASLNSRMQQTITRLAAAYRTAADDLRIPPDTTIPLSGPASGATGAPPPPGEEGPAGFGPGRGPNGIVDAVDTPWTPPGFGGPGAGPGRGPAGATPVEEEALATEPPGTYNGRPVAGVGPDGEELPGLGGNRPGAAEPTMAETNAPWITEGEPSAVAPGGPTTGPAGVPGPGRGNGWSDEDAALVGQPEPDDPATANGPADFDGVLGRGLRQQALRQRSPGGGPHSAQPVEDDPSAPTLGGTLGRTQPPQETSQPQPATSGDQRVTPAPLMTPLSSTADTAAWPPPSATSPPTAHPVAHAVAAPSLTPQTLATPSTTAPTGPSQPAAPSTTLSASGQLLAPHQAVATSQSLTVHTATDATPLTQPVTPATTPPHAATTTPASVHSAAASPLTSTTDALTATPATIHPASPAAPVSAPSITPLAGHAAAPSTPLVTAPTSITSTPAVPAVPAAPTGAALGEYRMHPPPQLLMNSYQQAAIAAGGPPPDGMGDPFVPGGFPGTAPIAPAPGVQPVTGLTAPFFAGNAPPPVPGPLLHDPTAAQVATPSGVLGRPHQPDTLPPSPVMPPPVVTGHGPAPGMPDAGDQRRPATWWLHLDGDETR